MFDTFHHAETARFFLERARERLRPIKDLYLRRILQGSIDKMEQDMQERARKDMAYWASLRHMSLPCRDEAEAAI